MNLRDRETDGNRERERKRERRYKSDQGWYYHSNYLKSKKTEF
jgi:hypothetical protein